MQTPPKVPGNIIWGNAWRVLSDPLKLIQAAQPISSDVVDLDLRLLPAYLIKSPELIEHVLVSNAKNYIKDTTTRALSAVMGEGLLTSEGDYWKKRRRLAQPAFHRERVEGYAQVMIDFTERMSQSFQIGSVIDIQGEMNHLTRDIAAKTLFNADVSDPGNAIGDMLSAIVGHFVGAYVRLPLLDKLPLPANKRFKQALSELDQIIYGIIQQRRESGADPGDLLSMLMNAKDEQGEHFTERQLRDEVMTLFLAGHETTATALTWTFVLLSKAPAVYAALQRELREVLGKDRPPTLSDLPKLRYTEWVVYESMRLCPPAWAIGREATSPDELGGFDIPVGHQIWISQYVAHRDPRYFDHPNEFRPERWDNDFAKKLPRFAYFPFGGGPRICIGNTFALMETILVLASICRRFHIKVLPHRRIRTSTAITYRPMGGVYALIDLAPLKS